MSHKPWLLAIITLIVFCTFTLYHPFPLPYGDQFAVIRNNAVVLDLVFVAMVALVTILWNWNGKLRFVALALVALMFEALHQQRFSEWDKLMLPVEGTFVCGCFARWAWFAVMRMLKIHSVSGVPV